MKRMIKFTALGIAVVAIMALALALTADAASAQGPGGNRGGNRGAGGYGQNQTGTGQYYDPTLPHLQPQDGTGYSYGNSNSNRGGYGTQNGTGQYIDPALQPQDSTGYSYGNQGGYGAQQGGAGQYGAQGTTPAWIGYTLDNLPPANPDGLSADALAALTAALQDEHNAYAAYQSVIDQFGTVRPFSMIQQSEAHHIALLEALYARYGLNVPAIQPAIPADQFASVTDACALGANAEVANFGLYDAWITSVQADYPDLAQVFTVLRNASEYQHLPAFERCAG